MAHAQRKPWPPSPASESWAAGAASLSTPCRISGCHRFILHHTRGGSRSGARLQEAKEAASGAHILQQPLGALGLFLPAVAAGFGSSPKRSGKFAPPFVNWLSLGRIFAASSRRTAGGKLFRNLKGFRISRSPKPAGAHFVFPGVTLRGRANGAQRACMADCGAGKLTVAGRFDNIVRCGGGDGVPVSPKLPGELDGFRFIQMGSQLPIWGNQLHEARGRGRLGSGRALKTAGQQRRQSLDALPD